jgi:hypothetical protein
MVIFPERLVPYVIQRIEDEGGIPNRTRVLKIIYLIDLEYFRRHRWTATGWRWVYHYFGPYAFEYPKVLQKIGMSLIDEAEDETANAKRVYKYHVAENQQIADIVGLADLSMIDDIVHRWALDDLNILLNHAYFETEPMVDAKPGDVLDFNRIRAESPTVQIRLENITISKDQREQFRERLAAARRQSEARLSRTSAYLRESPIRADALYRDAMETRDEAESRPIGEGVAVEVRQEPSDPEWTK